MDFPGAPGATVGTATGGVADALAVVGGEMALVDAAATTTSGFFWTSDAGFSGSEEMED